MNRVPEAQWGGAGDCLNIMNSKQGCLTVMENSWKYPGAGFICKSQCRASLPSVGLVTCLASSGAWSSPTLIREMANAARLRTSSGVTTVIFHCANKSPEVEEVMTWQKPFIVVQHRLFHHPGQRNRGRAHGDAHRRQRTHRDHPPSYEPAHFRRGCATCRKVAHGPPDRFLRNG